MNQTSFWVQLPITLYKIIPRKALDDFDAKMYNLFKDNVRIIKKVKKIEKKEISKLCMLSLRESVRLIGKGVSYFNDVKEEKNVIAMIKQMFSVMRSIYDMINELLYLNNKSALFLMVKTYIEKQQTVLYRISKIYID